MSGAQRVFLVDDQDSVLTALARLLASAGLAVAAFPSARAFLDSGLVDAPGCLVLDLAMPEMDGLMLQQQMASRNSLLPLIFLSGNAGVESSVRAMKGGALDFLTKPVDDECLLAAVRAGFARNARARAERAACDEIRQRLASLTAREHEVLALVLEGKLNKQVADALGIAEKTIKVHRAHMLAKMKVRSLTGLVRLVDRVAQERGAQDRGG